MIIITYSDTTADTIEKRIGTADYSYYFILKGYLPALERLGRVVAVSNPTTEVDRIYRDNPNEECVFLCFTPPHRAITGLKCPTVCVFAWEFSTIPSESWHDTPEYNWTVILESLRNAITISQYSYDVVHAALGEKLNLAVIPTPVNVMAGTPTIARTSKTVIHVNATLYDSAAYSLTTDMVNDEAKSTRDPLKMEPWDSREIKLTFSEENPDATQLLIGFYSPEDWGCWTRTKAPWIMLPYIVTGPVRLELELVAYGTNIDREIQISLGGETRTISPAGLPQTFQLDFQLTREADIIKLSNLDLTHAPGARDHRSLGLGILSMTLRRPKDFKTSVKNKFLTNMDRIRGFLIGKFHPGGIDELNELELKGVVYTTVMNPQDGRKNWDDLVRAFCWAFREEENATLVLKMTHHNLATFLGNLLLLYSQMAPYKCRVVAVHGFLTSEQYDALMSRTHYVVNSSHCEGQCLPLMEYMGQGKPAIAPNHTAMADYIDENNSFIVKSSLYPTHWPIDERRAYRTLCYRIDWESLKNAFVESYHVVMNDPQRYESMSRQSVLSVEKTASQLVVHEKLKHYIATTAKQASKDFVTTAE